LFVVNEISEKLRNN